MGFLLSYCYKLEFNSSIARNVNAFRLFFTNMGAKRICFETINSSVITTKFQLLSELHSSICIHINTQSLMEAF